jgi:hypothetical protein
MMTGLMLSAEMCDRPEYMGHQGSGLRDAPRTPALRPLQLPFERAAGRLIVVGARYPGANYKREITLLVLGVSLALDQICLLTFLQLRVTQVTF